jgi:hypothetical protein
MIARKRGRFFALLLPRAALAPLVTNIDDAVLRLIPASTGVLKLLVNYVGMIGASRQRISESYVRKLFESEGSSFSECVLGQRLSAPTAC